MYCCYVELFVCGAVGGFRNRTPPPSMDVSHLINQLAGYGMLDGSKNESGGLTRNTPPVTVPTLGFTSATLKQLVVS